MKKTISVILAAMLIIAVTPLAVFAEDVNGGAVAVSAKSAILVEVESGRVLFSKNPDEKLPPASITKIMSLLLVMEALDDGKITIDEVVTATKNAASKAGSQIWLEEGEKMTVNELLKATAIASANDACTALGEHIAGDEQAFVALMNERAKQLGMKNTNFENCTGLDDTVTNHYTTASDVAIMTCELIKHKKIRDYTTVWMDSLRNGKTELVNTNRLVRFYEGTTGLKTGTTSKAGYCVSATAEREGLHLAAVVLGGTDSTERFEDAKKMLNWGFANFSLYTPSPDPALITGVGVLMGETDSIMPYADKMPSVIVKKGSEDNITQRVDLCVDVEAPVEKNQKLGTVYFELDGKVICECALKSPVRVERRGFFFVFSALWSSFAKKS